MPGRWIHGRVPAFFASHPLVTSLAFVMIGILPVYLTSAQVLALESDLGLGAARLGLTTSTYFGTSALAATPAARIIRSRGATNGLRLGCGLSAAASLVAGTAVFWQLLLLAAALAGIANSFMQVGTNILIYRDAAFHRQGMTFGAKQAAIPLANVVAGAMLPLIGVTLGWRWSYLVAGVWALLLMTWAPPVSEAPPETQGRRDRRRLPKSLVLLAIGGAAGGAAGNAIAVYVVLSAVDVGITEAVAGGILSIMSAVVVLVRIGAGATADRRRSTGHQEMATLLAMGSVGCLILAATSTPTLYLVAMPMAMLGSWGWPGVIYFAVVRSHPDIPERASGVILAGNLTGTLTGPLIVGLLAGAGAYPAAWLFCGTLSIVAMVSFLASKRVGAAPVATV